ncbi:hypothetical protein SLA2020_476520 [Shorea laevis]
MNRAAVNGNCRGFNKNGVRYDWKMKVGAYLPDGGTTVISSIFFMPLQGERYIEATMTRSMAWFSAAIASGVPLIFVNIQTEQIVTSEKINSSGKEKTRGKQQNQISVELVRSIRLWFLPGSAEVSLEMTSEPGETWFGMDIKRTDEIPPF